MVESNQEKLAEYQKLTQEIKKASDDLEGLKQAQQALAAALKKAGMSLDNEKPEIEKSPIKQPVKKKGLQRSKGLLGSYDDIRSFRLPTGREPRPRR